MNGKLVVKAVAVGLVAPVFLEHKPHLDITVAVEQVLPSNPFNVVSTATASTYRSLLNEWMFNEPK